MAPRLLLQELLEELVDNVYFQPPNNIKMQYPAIVYFLDSGHSEYADNEPYRRVKRYSLTVITRDPDSITPDRVGDMPMSTFNRVFMTDNLNHYVFTLFF